MPITISLRVRDKTEEEIKKFVNECIGAGFSGILIVMGDPARNGMPDSGQIPSKTVKKLRRDNLDSKIDLYLSVPNNPDFKKMRKKMDSKPKGFMTQVVQSVEQVKNLTDNLDDFLIIPIVLFPSAKNEKPAKFLGLNLNEYAGNFGEFVNRVQKITGDVLITSPNDSDGLKKFLEKTRGQNIPHRDDGPQ